MERNSTETADVEVAGIFDNYINNYMFITGRTYEDLYGEEPLYKDAYVITDKEDKYAVSALISKEDSVTTISIVNDIRVMVNNMMKSLDSIIWLVIACAGALGFVVIYNLNNINITERAREIATLKVLGFYQDETGAYVFRETFSLTLIGGILGLVMGKFLHMFIMNQIKVEMVSFKQQIFGVSYLISLLATFIVTFLVNWILRKKIDKINMAESLKSVE
jgi:putative ABC transport system permease protein